MPLDVTLDPREVGLLVVDMQNGFCHPEGTRGQAFGADAVSQPREIVPRVAEAHALAHHFDIPVWFTRQVHYNNDLTRARRRIPSHLERRGVDLQLCRHGTWDAELLEELEQLRGPEDEVIVKHRSSAFFRTPLEHQLTMRGVQVLIVTGTTTSFCVDSTIRDAYARDLDVLVPAECVADSELDAHRATLACVDRFHGVVTSLQEIEQALKA